MSNLNLKLGLKKKNEAAAIMNWAVVVYLSFHDIYVGIS